MRLAEPGEQDAEVVVDFGDGADGRPRRVAGVALFDGDRGRQAVDVVDLRLLHLADELPGVRAEAFDVSPLAFGVDRVHRERRLAGTAGAAEDGHFVARNFEVEVAQVVLPCAADGDVRRLAGRLAVSRSAFRVPPVEPGPSRIARCQQRREGLRRCATRDGRGDFFRRAAGNDATAACAAVGADVDDPVGGLDDVEIVLDDEHRVAGVDEVVQHLEQQLDIGEVQAGRRLVEQVHRAAGRLFHQLAGQLDALGFAAGERRRRLADLDVVEADLVQRAELVVNRRDVLEVAIASCTSISSTWAMLFSLYITCSVSRLKRWPLQTGHVTHTSARKSISSRFEPLPSHASQRPPWTLKLNRPGL